MTENDDTQHPFGTYEMYKPLSTKDRFIAIEVIALSPKELMRAVEGLTTPQIETPNGQDGWTIAQLIHHIADGDMTRYCWMRRALTETWPTVFAYDPATLAELANSRLPADLSLPFQCQLLFRFDESYFSLPTTSTTVNC